MPTVLGIWQPVGGGLVILAFTVLGALAIVTVLPTADLTTLLSIGFPLGSGLFTFVIFILNWAGREISLGLLVGVYLASIGALSMLNFTNGSLHAWHVSRSGRRTEESIFRQPFLIIILVLVAALIISATVYSVGRAYSSWDGAAQWAVKGYAIAETGSVKAVENWGMWGTSYPLNIMLQVATFKLLGTELLPASKLIFPAFLFSVSLGCLRFWRKQGVRRELASLGVLYIVTNPVLFIQSTNGYANQAFGALVALGVISLAEGVESNELGRQTLGGALLGIGAWTRPEGALYCIAIGLSLLILAKSTSKANHSLFRVLAPCSLIGLWLVFAWGGVAGNWLADQSAQTASTPLGNAFGGFIAGLRLGQFHLSGLIFVLELFVKRALAPDNWGAFLPTTGFLFLFAGLKRPGWKRLSNLYLAAAAVAAWTVPVLIYYAVSFAPFNDFELVLRRDFDRAVIPAFLVTTVLAVNLWADQD